MKLGSKVLLILLGTWAIISLIVFMDTRLTLVRDYQAIEEKEVIKDIQRAQRALNNSIASLKSINADWSVWDGPYQFMIDKNKKFLESNVTSAMFNNIKINFILFYDTTGKYFYGEGYDLKNKKSIPVPTELLNYIESEPSLTHQLTEQSGRSGLIHITNGYLVVSSLPILTGKGEGPSHGALLMAYFLGDESIKKLSETVGMNVDILPASTIKPSHPLEPNVDIKNNNLLYYMELKNKNYMYGFVRITDIKGDFIAWLRVESPRVIYNEGLMTVNRYLSIIILIGVVLLIVMWYLLKVFVLDRMISINKQLSTINSESQFSKRLNIAGKDEVGHMAALINKLMEIVELTQDQLKHRLSLNIEKSDRLSDLNKNLFTQMHKQKVTELKLREDEKLLRQMAYYDSLTGLPNRLFFNELLRKAINESDLRGIAILFLDIDKFKTINDTYGHDIGDKFLCHVATQLKNSIRETDTVARLAGDEFILFLNHMNDRDKITAFAKKVLANVSMPIHVNGHEIKATSSIGISIFPDDGQSIEELEINADLAMYYAKKQAGNAYIFFEDIKMHVERTKE